MSAVRLVLLTEIPAPFRIPLLNALAARDDVDLKVLFLAERDPRRSYRVFAAEHRFHGTVLPGRELRRGDRWIVLSLGVLGTLARARPDVVLVGGWNQPAFWQALVYARARRVPLVVWVESTARDARPGFGPLELAKRIVLRAAAAFVVPGGASREYLLGLGAPADRIAVAPNAVDLTIFSERVAAARHERGRLRAELGLDGCTFLYVGRLHRDKGVDVLVRALAGVPASLVVAGEGPERDALRAQAPAGVRFLGQLDRDELVPWYAAADALVLPSRSEPWGMVLNEAAAAGLPLVASDAAGAAHDLVEDGANGFRVPAGDETALAAALRRVAEDPAFRAAAGARSLELSRRFTPEAWARAIADLVRGLALVR